MQRRAGDGRAGEQDGVEFSDGRDGSGAADLHADLAEDGLGLVRRELERHRPMRELARRAGAALVFETVDLHHGAVGREREVAAQDVELLDGFPGGVDSLLDVDVVTDGEAPGFEQVFKIFERGECGSRFTGTKAVADDAEATLAGLFAVE